MTNPAYPNLRAMGTNLKAIARSRHMSVADIAEQVGVVRSTVFTHLNGENRPKLETLLGYMRWAFDPFFSEQSNVAIVLPDEAQLKNAIRVQLYAIQAIENGEVR